jgi:hypothetical protein
VRQDSYQLSDELRPVILVACSKCDWRAAFNRDELIAFHGATCAMPSLLNELTSPGCVRLGNQWDHCGVYVRREHPACIFSRLFRRSAPPTRFGLAADSNEFANIRQSTAPPALLSPLPAPTHTRVDAQRARSGVAPGSDGRLMLTVLGGWLRSSAT